MTHKLIGFQNDDNRSELGSVSLSLKLAQECYLRAYVQSHRASPHRARACGAPSSIIAWRMAALTIGTRTEVSSLF